MRTLRPLGAPRARPTNTNNVVIVERADGKFQLLPYSVDISAGQQWYPGIQLLGYARLAQGCQTDPTCWDAMLARCSAMLDQLDAMDVVGTMRLLRPVEQLLGHRLPHRVVLRRSGQLPAGGLSDHRPIWRTAAMNRMATRTTPSGTSSTAATVEPGR
jgi:hypothetical protein